MTFGVEVTYSTEDREYSVKAKLYLLSWWHTNEKNRPTTADFSVTGHRSEGSLVRRLLLQT